MMNSLRVEGDMEMGRDRLSKHHVTVIAAAFSGASLMLTQDGECSIYAYHCGSVIR